METCLSLVAGTQINEKGLQYRRVHFRTFPE